MALMRFHHHGLSWGLFQYVIRCSKILYRLKAMRFVLRVFLLLWNLTGLLAVVLPTGLSLGLHPANERRCYNVTLSLIGWASSELLIFINNPSPWFLYSVCVGVTQGYLLCLIGLSLHYWQDNQPGYVSDLLSVDIMAKDAANWQHG